MPRQGEREMAREAAREATAIVVVVIVGMVVVAGTIWLVATAPAWAWPLKLAFVIAVAWALFFGVSYAGKRF